MTNMQCLFVLGNDKSPNGYESTKKESSFLIELYLRSIFNCFVKFHKRHKKVPLKILLLGIKKESMVLDEGSLMVNNASFLTRRMGMGMK